MSNPPGIGPSCMISLSGIDFGYSSEGEDHSDSAGASLVLRDYTLEIERGSFVAVVGHNGSGKSTLAKLCNGLYIPDRGQVLVDGLDTAKEENQLAVRKAVGLVFQNPDNQLVSSIVEEDVAFGPENLGVPVEELRPRVEDALRAVDMLEYARHDTHKLSGGQKQRIAIAGILAMQPQCIVLDEPTAMLDPKGRAEVLETILRLNRQRGMTVVLITHYMNEAARADRMVVMDSGRIVLDGTPMEVFAQPDVIRAAGLDLPQPTEFVERLKAEGMNIGGPALSVEECVEALTALLEESPCQS